ncbi:MULTISPECIES: alginate export family protein [Niastella]|uniref:Alginate export family protein n=1 Tax=Niastella soli TaxID=2821487 RepID=A0ABS3YNH0_9BACT|nr:alginate export family protein [Niastella soli]MBO9198806.1 alginate export family protein [Niastella soli]
MRKKLIFMAVTGFGCFLGKPYYSAAQFSLAGQLRTRTEVRDGYGTLNAKGTDPAFLTSQRARLLFGYKWDRVNFNFSVQDVRVWGQDASTINNADGNKLMVHEAWAEVTLMNVADTTIKTKGIDNLSFKIGRQALIYDDVRLLGDLDWLQQGRRHDAILIKALHHGWQVDLGAGFNQNSDAFGYTGTGYVAGNVPPYVTNSLGELVATPSGLLPLSPNGAASAASSKAGAPVLANAVSTNGMNQQYKSMQMLYVSRKFGQIKFAGLFFKDDFAKYRLDSTGNATSGYVYGRRYDVKGVNSRLTYGLMINGSFGKATALKNFWQVGAYFQSGKDRDGKDLTASHYTASLTLQKGKFSFGPGYDYLSGNNSTTTATETHRFDPLYGTPHKHWGYMDYYYVGTGSPVGGLQDAYFKIKYQAARFFVSLDAHNFMLAENVANAADPDKINIDKNLGYEFDLIANYSLNKFTTLELGYSYMKANNSTEYIKRATMDQARHNANWAYLMINIRPDFFFKPGSK